MTYEERIALGEKIRTEVLGANYANASKADPTKFQQAFRQFTVEHCWGNVWVRPGLDRKSRSMLNLGMLAVLGRWSEFAVHVRGAINNGMTEEEMIEVVLQAGVYGGVPIAAEAMRVLERVVNETAAG